jgi:hypothetical protein
MEHIVTISQKSYWKADLPNLDKWFLERVNKKPLQASFFFFESPTFYRSRGLEKIQNARLRAF